MSSSEVVGRYDDGMTRLPALGSRGEGWVVAQGALLVMTAAAGWFGPAWDGPARVVGGVLGVVLIGAGAVLAIRGSRDLGTALTPFPHPLADATLIQTGVYRRVRHPIYGGIVLAVCRLGPADGIDPGAGHGGDRLGILHGQVDARGGVARRAFPRLPGVPDSHPAAHPLARLTSRGRNGSAGAGGLGAGRACSPRPGSWSTRDGRSWSPSAGSGTGPRPVHRPTCRSQPRCWPGPPPIPGSRRSGGGRGQPQAELGIMQPHRYR